MPPEPPPGPAQVVNKIAALLRADYFGNGPRAALRRMDPEMLAEPVLQRLLADYVPDSWLLNHGMADWSLIVHALALGSPDHLLGAKSLGAALAQAQYSESRLARLLQASRAQVNDVLPRACRFLVAKGEALNPKVSPTSCLPSETRATPTPRAPRSPEIFTGLPARQPQPRPRTEPP